jgi:hypothetical protein
LVGRFLVRRNLVISGGEDMYESVEYYTNKTINRFPKLLKYVSFERKLGSG